MFASLSGEVIALDKDTGAARWLFQGHVRPSGQVSTDGNRVYVAYDNGRLVALDLINGEAVWELDSEDLDLMGGTVVRDRRVYFASQNGVVHAVDSVSGEVVWRVDIGQEITAPPAVDDSILVVSTENRGVHALSITDGEPLWKFNLLAKAKYPARISDQTVYLGDMGGTVYALDASEGVLSWLFRTGDAIESTPLVLDDVVYFGSNDGYFYALDRRTSQIGWRFETGQDVAASAVTDGETVYIPSMDSHVYALTPGLPVGLEPVAQFECTSREVVAAPRVWSVDPRSSPADAQLSAGGTLVHSLDTAGQAQPWFIVGDEVIYRGLHGQSLYAAHFTTGEVKWRYTASGEIVGKPIMSGAVMVLADDWGCVHAVDRMTGGGLWQVYLAIPLRGGMATDGRLVYAALENGEIIAIDLEGGEIAWRAVSESHPTGGLTVADGKVYLPTDDSLVVALSAENGARLWAGDTLSPSHSTPLAAGDFVLVGSPDERVYAFDAQSGRLVWNFWSGRGGGVLGSVFEADGAVYFTSDDGFLYSLNLGDGSLRWRREIGSPGSFTPISSEGLVYAVSEGDRLNAIDASNGSIVWQHSAAEDITFSPVVDEGTVYIGSSDGRVSALATGFPADYVSVPPQSPPEFTPLTPEEMRSAVAFITSNREWHVRIEGAVYKPDGAVERVPIDHSKPILDLFGTAYYLLTGRSYQQDGIEMLYLTRKEWISDYGKGFGGYCCDRTDNGLRLVIRGEFGLSWSLGATAHEAGHALQRILNPAQMRSRSPLAGPLWEAQAGAFEGAIGRTIGRYADIETAEFTDSRDANREIDGLSSRMKSSLEKDSDGPHDRSSLIIWHAIFNDPDLAHLRTELEDKGKLSPESYMELFYKLAMIPPSDVDAYVKSITPDRYVSDQLNIMAGILRKRAGHYPHPDYLGVSRLTVLLP